MPGAVDRRPRRRRWLRCCATIIALMVAWSLPPIAAKAATAASSVNPAADTFVSASAPAGNFGAAGALEVSGAGTSKGEFQSLLKFDLSAAKSSFDATLGAGHWQVQSATLQLTTANPSPQPVFNANAAGQFAVAWMQNDGWSEGTGGPGSPTTDGVTWATLPSFLSPADAPLGTFAFPGGTSGANTYTLSLPTGFSTDIFTGDTAGLRISAADTAMSYLFNSRNNGTASSRPLLTITAATVPEPTFGLACAGSCFVAAWRRHRRRVAHAT